MVLDCRFGRDRVEVCFDFANPLLEAKLDLRHGGTFAEVTSLVEVLQIRAQFLQKFLGKSRAHRRFILHNARCECKITRLFRWAAWSFIEGLVRAKAAASQAPVPGMSPDRLALLEVEGVHPV